MSISQLTTLDFWFYLALGPLFVVSLLVGIVGTVLGTRRVLALTTLQPPRPQRPARKKPTGLKRIAALPGLVTASIKNSFLIHYPLVLTVSTVFHLIMLGLPVFLLAHNILIADAIGFGLPSLPEGLADKLTLIFLACALFFLLRRILSPRVRSITGPSDYGVLIMATLPFITGALAFYQVGDYKLMITLHMLSGEFALAVAPFTKIFHMVYFFVGRFILVSEHTLGRGSRTW